MSEHVDNRPVEVQKADMAVSQLTAGGALVTSQEDRFFLVAIKKAMMMQKIYTLKLDRNQHEIPKLTTFGSQIWFPATEMEELPLAERVRPGTGKVTIATDEIMCQVNFPKYFLKAQVERAQFQNTLISYLGLHSARDFDNKLINGATTSANKLLALQDGIIALTTTNVYTPAGGPVSLETGVFDRLQLTLPEEYEDQDGMAFYTCRGAKHAFKRELQARIGQIADSQVLNRLELTYDGLPVIRVPMWPTGLGGGLNETTVLYGSAKQFIFGLEEGTELETEYHKASRSWSIIMTARVGQTYQHEPAMAMADSILDS